MSAAEFILVLPGCLHDAAIQLVEDLLETRELGTLKRKYGVLLQYEACELLPNETAEQLLLRAHANALSCQVRPEARITWQKTVGPVEKVHFLLASVRVDLEQSVSSCECLYFAFRICPFARSGRCQRCIHSNTAGCVGRLLVTVD